MYLHQLARLVGHWMATEGQWLGWRLGSSWDVVTTVPSSRRPTGAPVDAIVAGVPGLQRRHRQMLARGPSSTGHLVADRQGFVLDPGLDLHQFATKTVLVVDDSVITGARAQSAAAALRIGGVRVAGVLTVGRAFDPSRRLRVPRAVPGPAEVTGRALVARGGGSQ
jgi:predicted amidophosphoribosyltransferase